MASEKKTEKITIGSLNSWLTENRKRGDYWRDTEVKDFDVRVNSDSPSGQRASASYRVRVSVNGSRRTRTISKVGEIDLKTARKHAANWKIEGKVGIDKRKEKKEALQIESERKANETNKPPTLQKWFDDIHHDSLYERGKKTRIRYFERWLVIFGHLRLDQITIESVAKSLRTYGPKVRKESSDKKNMELFKELASAYTFDNKCNNPLANSKWSSFVHSARLTWETSDNEDQGDTRTAIEREVFIKLVQCLERLCIEYPDNVSPLAILFMAYSGMRPSDIVSLEWKHININEPSFLHIRKVLQKTKNKNRLHSRIPISPEAAKILGRAKLLSGGKFVFSESTKAKGVANLGTVWWSKVRKETGIKFVLYQLRHNIAHQIISGGGTITQVAATLGNTVEICVRTYLQNDPKEAAIILTKLDYFKSDQL